MQQILAHWDSHVVETTSAQQCHVTVDVHQASHVQETTHAQLKAAAQTRFVQPVLFVLTVVVHNYQQLAQTQSIIVMVARPD